MIITFFGHSNFVGTEKFEKQIFCFLEETVGDAPAEMYLGGYGGFDSFAYECCKKYQASHENVSLIFVTPYLTLDYQKKRLNHEKTRYDAILYPEIENKPLKFAIRSVVSV